VIVDAMSMPTESRYRSWRPVPQQNPAMQQSGCTSVLATGLDATSSAHRRSRPRVRRTLATSNPVSRAPSVEMACPTNRPYPPDINKVSNRNRAWSGHSLARMDRTDATADTARYQTTCERITGAPLGFSLGRRRHTWSPVRQRIRRECRRPDESGMMWAQPACTRRCYTADADRRVGGDKIARERNVWTLQPALLYIRGVEQRAGAMGWDRR
jgi:hypothetical protein